jgi:acyl phosphate:glycerol-3-phosphate acyltransferase
VPALTILLCYAIGCLSPAWLAVKWRRGTDLRQHGTGTLGATNAARMLGRPAYVFIALMDMLKGWAALHLAARMGLSGWEITAAALAVTAGHIWPAPLRFRGGKGLATAHGTLLFIHPVAALLMWPVLAAAWLLLRRSTPAALYTFAAAPVLMAACHAGPHAITTAAVLALLITWTHRTNLRAAFRPG